MPKSLRIQVELQNGKVTFTDENGKDATEKHSRGKDKDYFKWCTNSGRLDFEFPNGHPFYSPPDSVLGPGCGKSVQVADPTQHDYKYNITLTDGGGQTHPVDPKVIIDGGLFNIMTILILAIFAFGAGLWFVRRRFFRQARLSS
jgi:hypothetical protein